MSDIIVPRALSISMLLKSIVPIPKIAWSSTCFVGHIATRSLTHVRQRCIVCHIALVLQLYHGKFHFATYLIVHIWRCHVCLIVHHLIYERAISLRRRFQLVHPSIISLVVVLKIIRENSSLC